MAVERRGLGLREAAAALGILAVLLLLILGVLGLWSFGNSTDRGHIPAADVTAGFRDARAQVELPFVEPIGLPSNWQPNSFQLVDPAVAGGEQTLVRTGWITPAGRFITLVQSTGSAADLVTSETGTAATSTGTIAAGGSTWSVYPSRREEVAWVRSAAPLTLLITGSASETDFRTLAAAIAANG